MEFTAIGKNETARIRIYFTARILVASSFVYSPIITSGNTMHITKNTAASPRESTMLVKKLLLTDSSSFFPMYWEIRMPATDETAARTTV